METPYLTSSYDTLLVILSFFLATMASFAALGLGARLPHVSARHAPYWLVGGAFAMGIGIWSMHFVGMLAFHLPIPLAYDELLTAASVLIAILASGLALYVMRQGITDPLKLALGSLLMGGGIGGMHYTGMAALKMFPPIHYQPALVALSLVIAVTASYVAIRLSFAASRSKHFIFTPSSLMSAVIMGIAIAGMHYTGMFAANFPVGSVCQATQSGMDSTLLAVTTTLASITILGITLLLLTFDIRLAAKDAYLVNSLKQKNEELEQRAHELAGQMTTHIRETAEHHRLLAAIIEQAGTAIFTTNADGNITSWNSGAERLFNYTDSEATDMPLAAIQADTGADEVYMREELKNAVRERFLPMRNKQGKVRYVDMDTSHLYDQQGETIGEVHIVHDVTTEKDAYDNLMLMGEVFHHSGEAIVITDSENKIVSVNAAFSRITGYTSADVIGRTPAVLASGRHDKDFYQAMWHQLKESDYWRGEIWNRRKNGDIYPEWLTITVLRDAHGKVKNHIAIFTDVSQYKEREAKIEYLAHHDTLTRLPNRLLLRDRLEQSILHAHRQHTQVALLFVDLDRFKVINDSLGHDIGDKLLIEVTRRLQAIIRDEDTVSRQGGDEFIIVLNDVEENQRIMAIAERIIESVGASAIIDGHAISITPSIGISIYPDDTQNIDELISKADAAMYHAKENGRATYQFFTEALNSEIQRRLRIERNLRENIENGRFILLFQPQHDLRSGKLIGAEALLRCDAEHAEHFGPDQFIPIAEETGLIIPIGEWVAREVCRQIGEWHKAGVVLPRISMNMSARQLDDGTILDVLYEALEIYGVHTHMLEVELTESAIMKNIQLSRDRLEQMQKMGISIAVDDFGTGYSSLSYLQRLPIDVLKIDASFVHDIAKNENSRKLAHAIINLASGLQLATVAEGIETQEQLDELKKSGCDSGQGYYFSQPMSVAEFTAYLQQHSIAS